ncbi:MAG: cupredoxin domain-containing protein [Actinobacteria bacterium]|nr:cupredoxin domain-containing protein [Actinomycetota bacterium]MDQ3531367.1 cupredoxin domain-containing protein [Actinomycetota bacterium]
MSEVPRSISAVLILLGIGMSAACGGTSQGLEQGTPKERREAAGGPGGDVSITLTAKDNTFQPKRLRLPAGSDVTLKFLNKGELPHTFTVRELDLDTGSIEPGGSKRVRFSAPDSRMQFLCTIHEFEGQVGDLIPR